MSQEPVDAILVNDAPENFLRRRLIVELVEKARLPAMYPGREHVEVGGLMAYAFDFPELYRYAAHQVDQILKGAKPGEIPFYQATKYELVINLKTAKQIGIFPAIDHGSSRRGNRVSAARA
jgi:putative ABC transport system substrate-binding protein